MIINITQKCTLRCEHCMQNAGPERTEMMPKETFLQALEFAKQIGSRVVSISGGEPTVHPLFFEFLDMALDRNFFAVSVLSNGTFLRDRAFTETFIKQVEHKNNFYLQITSIKGLYSNYDEVHKPGLKALRLLGKQVAICDDFNEIKMQPLGRACTGKWYEEAKKANAFPSCANSCLLLAQTMDWGIRIGELMEMHQRFCLPIVSWNGSIRLGESEQCKVIANISEPIETINKKLREFRPCGGCDSYKWHFLKPQTLLEKEVCSILWPTKNN